MPRLFAFFDIGFRMRASPTGDANMKLLVQLCIALLVVVASHSQSIQSEREVVLAPAAPEPTKPKDPGQGAQLIAEAVVEGFVSEKFTRFYDFMPSWMTATAAEKSEAMKWRMKEGWDRWKDFRKRLEGDNGLDPKDKSGITNSEAKWIDATDAQRGAVMMGFYRVYAVDAWEQRLKEGQWFLDNRVLRLEVEGQGRAEFRYSNRYRDGISVQCVREGGVWYCAGVDIKMERTLPEKPKD
jgi:hypothetical protein